MKNVPANILVVNDDGIEALGVHKLAEALAESGDIYVCSPPSQQSATGHGITIGRPIYVRDAPFREAKHAIIMEGTPVDCVKIGLEFYRERGVEIDMVFSGFNHGMNLGTDTLYSGTVSAAIEGAICGLPSAALSITTRFSNHTTPFHFDTAMKVAQRIARSELFLDRASEDPGLLDINFINKDHIILTVNIPDLPSGEIKGVKVCPLSFRLYDDWFRTKADEAGRVGYHYSGMPSFVGEAEADDSDIIANELGYVTVTPLHFDLTDRRLLSSLREEWNGSIEDFLGV